MIQKLTKIFLLLYILLADVFPASASVLCIENRGHIALEPAHSNNVENIRIKHKILFKTKKKFLKNIHFHLHISLKKEIDKFILSGEKAFKQKAKTLLVLFAKKFCALKPDQYPPLMQYQYLFTCTFPLISIIHFIKFVVLIS